MQSRLSNTAAVKFLDIEGLVGRLRGVARSLVAAEPNVTAVVLFGSLARRSATPASDADLLVLLRADARRIIERIVQYSRPFEMPGLSVQVLAWTEAELSERLESGDRFAREILESGIVLAGAVAARGE
ncbi:MAG: nucleotidyltransferase domain-containing protein [Gemmatimonadales bacterium]